MSTPELEPLAPDLLALLEHERRAPSPPSGAKAAVQARLDRSLAGSAPVASSALAGGGRMWALGALAGVALVAGLWWGLTPPPQLEPPAAAMLATVPTPHEAPAAIPEPTVPPEPTESALVEVKPAASEPTTPQKVVNPTPVQPPVVEEAAAEPEAVEADVPKPARPRPAAERSPAARIAAERSLVERARRALRQGHASEAASAAREHRTRFPRGRLAEEREAIWIRALVRQGRDDAARTRAERFRHRYPRSIHKAAVDAAVGRAGQ